MERQRATSERDLLPGDGDDDPERPLWKRLLLVSFSLVALCLATRMRLDRGRWSGV